MSLGTVSQRTAYFLLLFTPMVWCVNYIVARLAQGQIAPHMLALCRWSLAGCVLGAFAWREIAAKRHLIWPDAGKYLVLGALGMYICGAWVYIGARTTSATNIGLIYALSPAFIALAASVWLHEKLKAWQWLGIGLAFAGLVHVVIKGQWGSLLGLKFAIGDVWIAACSVAWAVYSLLLKRWSTEFSPLARLVLIISAGCLVLLPGAVLELYSSHPLDQTHWNTKTISIILAAALLPGAAAYWMYSVTLKALGAARTSAMLYLGPLYGAGAAWLILGEQVHGFHLLGAVLIFAGVYLASKTGN
jgi:drug/metabolite transporter (DMT)-like permease